MERPEAAEILKEILQNCSSLEGRSVKLMPPDADSVLSKGFQIHLQKSNEGIKKNCIYKIAKKHGLQVYDEEDFLVIYRSML
jgi:hypothetical protein